MQMRKINREKDYYKESERTRRLEAVETITPCHTVESRLFESPTSYTKSGLENRISPPICGGRGGGGELQCLTEGDD